MNTTALLHLALALLIAAQQPNVPDSLRNTAVDVANRAIFIAMEEKKPIVVPPQEEAPYGTEQVVWGKPSQGEGKQPL